MFRLLRGKAQRPGDSGPAYSQVHNVVFSENREIQGGIETWILDFCKLGLENYYVFGMGNYAPEPLTRTHLVKYFSLIRKNYFKPLPDGLALMIGILRHRGLFTSTVFVHRIELVFWLKLILPKARVVLFVHTNLAAQQEFDSGYRWQLRGPLYSWYEKWALRAPELVVVYSSKDFARVRGLARQAIEGSAWYNDEIFGVNVSLEKHGFVWVGRFHSVKDPWLAIKAFALTADQHESTLKMIGDGPELQNSISLAQSLGVAHRVEFIRPLSQKHLARTLSRTQFLLHTSHFEGAPRILVEAAAEGLVLITCAESDPEEIAQRSGRGIQVTSRTPEHFAEAILQAVATGDGAVSGEFLNSRRGSVAVRKLETEIRARLESGS